MPLDVNELAQRAMRRGPDQAPARGPDQTPARGPDETTPRGPDQTSTPGPERPVSDPHSGEGLAPWMRTTERETGNARPSWQLEGDGGAQGTRSDDLAATRGSPTPGSTIPQVFPRCPRPPTPAVASSRRAPSSSSLSLEGPPTVVTAMYATLAAVLQQLQQRAATLQQQVDTLQRQGDVLAQVVRHQRQRETTAPPAATTVSERANPADRPESPRPTTT